MAAIALALLLGSVPAHANKFTYANQGDALSMDPYMFNESVLLNFTGNLYEPLVGRGKKLELAASAGHRMEADRADGMALQATQRREIPGRHAFTADDVIFSYERAAARART